MTFFRVSIGKKGEMLAADYLCNKGYSIVQKNYRTRYGEIDLICRDRETLVFVEVKTKTSNRYGSPEEMFTPRKYQQVEKTAHHYLSIHPHQSNSIRIDLVALTITKEGQLVSLNHIQSVY